jgi:glycosyltransferase involved in cell wall biosynthesis
LKVLITNYSLAARGGTELYARDLAAGLLRRGHRPVVYSPDLGAVAEEIRGLTVPVADDLARVSSPPDVIHGHHLHETMAALLRFPGAPAVYVCHDWYSRLDAPPKFPRVLRCVAVDEVCYDKLVREHGVPEDRVRLLPSFVDLERFAPRPPLPARPERALILCNYAEEGPHLAAAREAFARAGIRLDAMGKLLGRPCERPEAVLGHYDIVLAKGRAALEALATGAAVILHVQKSVGPMVTAGELDRLLPLNCGIRAMTALPDPAEFAGALLREIERYDPEDAARASRRVREACGSDRAADEFISIYEEVIAESAAAGATDPSEEGLAAATYLQELLMSIREERRALRASNTFRLKERLRRVPLAGRLSVTIARRLAGKAVKDG